MEDIKTLLEFINGASSIVFFGGAGVSTESGIPDFRSKDGLYNRHDVLFEEYSPEYLLSSECLYHHPKVFYEFYRQKMDTRKAEPNITHKCLAKLEEIGKLSAVITQNIDGLHQKAGSRRVIELHGSTLRNYCEKCGNIYDENFIFEQKEVIPRCEKCGRMIRPAVTLYGESLPPGAMEDAIREIIAADLMMIAGTSLTVYPAAGLVRYFRGNHLVLINKEDLHTKIRSEQDLVFTNSMGRIFEKVYENL